MAKQVQEAYIVAATRTPVGKAPRGMFRNVRPDDMLAYVLKAALARCPGLDAAAVEDVIVGCAMPEAEQGMNVARIGLLLAGFPDTVPGLTVNRFCSSGVQAVAFAADRIRLGEAVDFVGDVPELPAAKCRISAVDPVNLTELDTPYVASVYGGKIATVAQANHSLRPLEPVYRVRFDHCDSGIKLQRELAGAAVIKGSRQSLLGSSVRNLMALARREIGIPL